MLLLQFEGLKVLLPHCPPAHSLITMVTCCNYGDLCLLPACCCCCRVRA
jgi:hypothetical protein